MVSLLNHFSDEDKPEAETDSPDGVQQLCSWCKQPVSKQVTLDGPSGVKIFCSEVCFDQCRRASFKKSKTCDWCKHARHTVNYVEFKDGSTELQFCGEKCLNQYKMSVFCKETQELSKKASNPEEEKDTDDRTGRDEILITPDLWLGNDRRRTSTEPISRRMRMVDSDLISENRRDRNSRVRSHVTGETLDLSKKGIEARSKSADNLRIPVNLSHNVKQEPHNKHTRVLFSNKSDIKVSQSQSESIMSPPAAVPNLTQLPAHALHPAIAGLAPWLPPGLLPYMQMAPLMMAGMVPPVPAEASRQTDEKEGDSEKRGQKRDPILNHRIETPGPSTSQFSDMRTPITLPDRRTSSLFPVDFPHFLQHAGIPGNPFQQGMPDVTAQRPPLPGIPPVTVMMPFPVVLPVPVPIPIPIPLTLAQLTSLFGNKKDSSNSSQKSNSVSKDADATKEAKSPYPPFSQSPQSVTSTASDGVAFDRQPVRSSSRTSLPGMTSYTLNDIRLSKNETFLKRSRTPESLDLSKTSKIARYEVHSYSSHSNDGVIDLSSTRDNRHKSEDNYSESGAFNESMSDENSMTHDPDSDSTADGSGVPKIHIITHKDDAPLNMPLPLPPTENPYSSRRGRILDAPVIPKKSRSPSPERRIYVRNVPRDIIEAARRRSSIRSRIRTK